MSTHEPDGRQGWPPPDPFAPPNPFAPPHGFAPPSSPRTADRPLPTAPTGERVAPAGTRTEPLDVGGAGQDAVGQRHAGGEPDEYPGHRPQEAHRPHDAHDTRGSEQDTERLAVAQPATAPATQETERVEVLQHAQPYGARPFSSGPGVRGAGPEQHAGGQWNPWSPVPAWPSDTAGRGLGEQDAPEPRERRRRALSVVWLVPILVLSLLAGALGGVLADRALGGARLADAGLPMRVPSDDPARPAASIAGIAATVLPSVVSIEVTAPQGRATGSGFVLRQDGYLMTNNHVIAAGAEPGADIRVVFADGSEEPATIVGRTSDYDLAVLKVERTGLAPLLLADSSEVVVGDAVVAVGAPLGLEGTVTTGIVSALNRPVQAGASDQAAFINAIQTDAAINPGNSGGPLVNGAGEVIGINSAIAQPPGGFGAAPGSIGLGFAIPSNQARRTASELIETGSATYPIIGVLLDESYTGEGVQVSDATGGAQAPVTAGGPADDAGIRPGDVIVAIDGRPVTQPDELIVAIRAKAPGDTTVLRVRTGDDERDVRVVLDQATSD